MNLLFNESLAYDYKSNSQKIRILSESWVEENIYCPCCGNETIDRQKNNAHVADFSCSRCGEIYELKSKNGVIRNKINDGAYATMLARIENNTNTDLFVMRYDNYAVTDFYIVPKFFFTPDMIEKRKPLSLTARRAGWQGCNILFGNIPEQGKIQMIASQMVRDCEKVIQEYAKLKGLKTDDIATRGWLMDILECVNYAAQPDFTLKDIYKFAPILAQKHPDNNNIEAKIRQQLQILRDKGFVEFLGCGRYKKI